MHTSLISTLGRLVCLAAAAGHGAELVSPRS
jgi:hypothetical protein